MSTELTVVKGGAEENGGMALSVSQEQRMALKNAAALANDVAKLVRENGLSKRFGQSPKEHVFIEGWLTISRVNNEQPHSEVKSVTRDPESGAETIHARAWITNVKGDIVSEADGYCSNEEGNWNGKPFYARASMAQTRALGKAMRIRHAWVMVMAGFAPTPAEEMDGIELEPVARQPQPKLVKAVLKAAPVKEVSKPVLPPSDSSNSSQSVPTVIPDTEPQAKDMAMESVVVVNFAKEAKESDPPGKWWKIGIRCRFANNREEWVNCWSKTKYEVFLRNKGKNVLLTYSTGEYNNKPQYTVEDVQEVSQ